MRGMTLGDVDIDGVGMGVVRRWVWLVKSRSVLRGYCMQFLNEGCELVGGKDSVTDGVQIAAVFIFCIYHRGSFFDISHDSLSIQTLAIVRTNFLIIFFCVVTTCLLIQPFLVPGKPFARISAQDDRFLRY